MSDKRLAFTSSRISPSMCPHYALHDNCPYDSPSHFNRQSSQTPWHRAIRYLLPSTPASVGWARLAYEFTRAPRKLLTGWVEHPRPIGCPQMTWGRTLKKVLKSVNLPTDFVQWRTAAADRDQWRVICGSKSRTQEEIPNLSRIAIWDKLRYGAAQPL